MNQIVTSQIKITYVPKFPIANSSIVIIGQ